MPVPCPDIILQSVTFDMLQPEMAFDEIGRPVFFLAEGGCCDELAQQLHGPPA
jgi:hypothetical protein